MRSLHSRIQYLSARVGMNIQSITLYPCSIPLKQPVVTSFGKMLARSSLLVAVTDSEGNIGWGECWCNFPSGGMAYKVRNNPI